MAVGNIFSTASTRSLKSPALERKDASGALPCKGYTKAPDS